MPVITLTTDWNLDDYYVGALKGKIYSKYPDVKIIDITHQIPPHNIARGAFVLKNSYLNFQEGTIHIIGINSEPGPGRSPLVIYADNHYFIGTDNGIFGLIFKNNPDKVVEIKWDKEKQNSSFPELSIFADTACYILHGGDIEEIGEVVSEYNKRIPIRAAIEESVINGSVIYIDSYQNAITNISSELFNRIGKNRTE